MIHNGFCIRCLSSAHHSELIPHLFLGRGFRQIGREFGRIGREFNQNGREFGGFGRGFGGRLGKMGRIGKTFANSPCAQGIPLGRLGRLDANPSRARTMSIMHVAAARGWFRSARPGARRLVGEGSKAKCLCAPKGCITRTACAPFAGVGAGFRGRDRRRRGIE